MGEKQGVRENIDRMTKQLIGEGRCSPQKASEIARRAALQVEHGEGKRNVPRSNNR